MIKNTKTKGTMRFIFLKEKDQFFGVCLDFNLMEEGKTLEKVKKHLLTASQLHLQTVVEKKLSDELLNRHAPKKYWNIYNSIQKNDVSKKRSALPAQAIASPYFGNRSFLTPQLC